MSLATSTVRAPPSDVHTEMLMTEIGQFYDMLYLYSMTGEPSDKHCLLMNGDLVDRGSWSIEVILTAFAYKCEYLLPLISSAALIEA